MLSLRFAATTLASAIAIASLIQKAKMIGSNFLLLLAAYFVSPGFGSWQPRIIGGRNIDIEEAPWQVSLLVFGNHHCGGSIYSDRIIITAAHCFYISLEYNTERLLNSKEIIVIAGSVYTRPRETLAAVLEKRHHEEYYSSSSRIVHDIGIMKLTKPFKISNLVKPIPLALENPAPGSRALATGWGLIVRSSEIPAIYPEILQGVHIYIRSFDGCKKIFPFLNNDAICAGSDGHSICSGDSGGPLVFKNTLVGVVSAGPPACAGPDLYASVAYHHKWLINAIKSISKEKVRSGPSRHIY